MPLILNYKERVILKRGLRCISINGTEDEKKEASDLLTLLAEHPDCERWIIAEELSPTMPV